MLVLLHAIFERVSVNQDPLMFYNKHRWHPWIRLYCFINLFKIFSDLAAFRKKKRERECEEIHAFFSLVWTVTAVMTWEARVTLCTKRQSHGCGSHTGRE